MINEWPVIFRHYMTGNKGGTAWISRPFGDAEIFCIYETKFQDRNK